MGAGKALVRDIQEVIEAGEALVQRAGNEEEPERCGMKRGDVERPWVIVKGWRCEPAFFCLLFFAAAKKSRCRPA